MTPTASVTTDPFLCPRDAREEGAATVMREFLLRSHPPAEVFRQGGIADGYALVIPRSRGERLLTVPCLNEADFMFHGNADTTAEHLADFVAGIIHDSKADHLKLPLLTHEQAQALRGCLAERLPEWRLAVALASVAPLARKPVSEPGSLRRAAARAERTGFALEITVELPIGEIRELHSAAFGNNRNESFFGMFRALLERGYAELLTLRSPDGHLVAAQFDIVGSVTRHYYYSICDTQRAAGCGTAVLAASWRRFAEAAGQRIYSFGRGSERYKYRYANACCELFEVRGFFVPEACKKGFVY